MDRLPEVWSSKDPDVWEHALGQYWEFVLPRNLVLEREIDHLRPEIVEAMDASEWYDFLLEKYFRWKFTPLNR